MTPAPQSFWPRLVRHVLLVGVVLGVVGYVLGKGFLISHRMYSGGSYDPQNEQVLWRTPLVMAGIGVAMTVLLDGFAEMFRRRRAAVLTSNAPQS